MSNHTSQKIVDHLFRHEYGRMVSVLVRVFGPSQLNLVEDAVQEAFIKAVLTWRSGKIPDNPSAWLHRVAKNKAIDLIRSNRSRNLRNEKFNQLQPLEEKLEAYLDSEIEDSQLRLIFTCCSLDLKEEDKIAITLQLISGFGMKEIAKALIIKEETVKKRLHRARSKLKNEDTTVELPIGKELHPLLNTAHKIIYLLFNEGYNSTSQDQLIRKDLCAEAMRLCRLIIDHPYCKSDSGQALMALMCYHSARLDSRLNTEHEIILLKDQDRTLWFQPLIELGDHYLALASTTEKFSVYHLEAAIAAQHSKSRSFEDTNWAILEKLYGILDEVAPNPVIKLNLSICRKENKDLPGALELIESLNVRDFYPNPYLYHAVAADIYYAIDQSDQAIEHLRNSLVNAPTESERKLIVIRLNEYENLSDKSF